MLRRDLNSDAVFLQLFSDSRFCRPFGNRLFSKTSDRLIGRSFGGSRDGFFSGGSFGSRLFSSRPFKGRFFRRRLSWPFGFFGASLNWPFRDRFSGSTSRPFRFFRKRLSWPFGFFGASLNWPFRDRFSGSLSWPYGSGVFGGRVF